MPELKPRAKIVARGTSGFTAVTTTIDIALNRPMPNVNYKVYYRQLTGLSVALPTTSNVTTSGFRATVGVGVAATFEYVVIED
jgi:hypothetical protein